MSTGTFPGMSLTFYGSESASGRYMKLMIGLSLALHVILLLMIAGLRVPGKTEHPLAAYQVSLVTLPTPPSEETKPIPQPVHPEPSKSAEPPKNAEPPKALPPPASRPTQQVVKEAPSLPPQPVRLAPTPHVRALEPISAKPIPVPPTPQVRRDVTPPPVPVPVRVPVPQVPPVPIVRQTEAKPVPVPVRPPPRPVLNRDVLRGMAQPDVPKLGQMNQIPAGTPKETRSQTQADVQKILNNLTVPESTPIASQPIPSEPVTPPPAARAVPQRPSVSEELSRQLQKLEQAPPKVDAIKTTVPVEPQVASKPPVPRTPVTTLQASGVAQGNAYLARVQQLISAQWIAPPVVDTTNQSFQVVVAFRLDKTGQVTNVFIERKSGNDYYDLAAIRAVQSARTLPPFPADMVQPYFDAHFSFAVGERVS